MGFVARSHHGATLQCGSVQGGGIAVRGGGGQGGGGEAHGAAGRWWVHGFLGCFLGDLLRNGEILGVGGIFFVKGL